ncbi:MAG: hypothetical protein GY943_19155 [Chloroflexi bacterium]|nr:hypothetical protein [Chloroflexota bacterium]
MHVRCTFCRQSFNLGRDYVVDAVAKATEKKHKFHQVECISCRKMIKIPVVQMKRFAPRPKQEEESEEQSSA